MSNKRTILLISILLFLPSCSYFNTTQNIIKKTYLIKGLMDLPALISIKDTITPLINKVIKEELDLDKNNPFSFFLPKNDQGLTLYYVYDMDAKAEDLFFTVIDDYHTKISNMNLNKVTLTSHIEFFGDNSDELVLIIDDPDQELTVHNQELKTRLHQLNDDYKKGHNHDLYDCAKSERYPYLPHIGLGRIRIRSINEQIKNAEQKDKIINRIRERIKVEIMPIIIQLLNEKNNKVVVQELGIFDLEKRKHIKTLPL